MAGPSKQQRPGSARPPPPVPAHPHAAPPVCGGLKLGTKGLKGLRAVHAVGRVHAAWRDTCEGRVGSSACCPLFPQGFMHAAAVAIAVFFSWLTRCGCVAMLLLLPLLFTPPAGGRRAARAQHRHSHSQSLLCALQLWRPLAAPVCSSRPGQSCPLGVEQLQRGGGVQAAQHGLPGAPAWGCAVPGHHTACCVHWQLLRGVSGGAGRRGLGLAVGPGRHAVCTLLAGPWVHR